MFGNAPEPASADLVERQPAKPVSALGQQAQAFFAGRGGKVASTTDPRPTRPGAPVRQRPPAARVVNSSVAPSSLFGDDGTVAGAARAAEMEAEADIIDDTFDDAFDGDAPGC